MVSSNHNNGFFGMECCLLFLDFMLFESLFLLNIKLYTQTIHIMILKIINTSYFYLFANH